MPDTRRKWCKGGCGRHTSECGPISWSGNCVDCAVERAAVNLTELHYMEGPGAIRWRARLVQRVEAMVPRATLAPDHPVPHTRELADA